MTFSALAFSSCDEIPGSDSNTSNVTEESEHTHLFGEWRTVNEATCTEDELEEQECSCGEKSSRPIPASCHTEVVDAAKAPTCIETGLTEGKHCSVCNEILVNQVQMPATGHTEVIYPAKAPTCTDAGLTEGKQCSACGTVIVKQEVIPANGHNFVDGICICGKKYSQGLRYTLNSDKRSYSVSGIGSCTDTDIFIPSTYNGKPVTGIGEEAFRLGSFTSITIPRQRDEYW